MNYPSISKKTFFLLIFQVILLLSVLTSYIVYSYNSYIQGIKQTADNYLKLYTKDLQSKINNADKVLERIAYDSTDYLILQSEKPEERYYASARIKQLLTTSLAFDEAIDFIVVGESNYKTFLMAETSGTSYSTKEDIKEFILSAADQQRIKSVWNIKNFNGTEYVYKMFVWQGRAIGIFISAEKFIEIEENPSDQKISSTTVFIQSCISGETIIKGSPENINNKSIKYETYIASDNIRVTAYTSHKAISLQIMSFGYILLLIIIIATSYAFVMMHSIDKNVLKPLIVINDHIISIQNGNYNKPLKGNFNTREFVTIETSFNSMIEQILNLKIEGYERQLELNQSELRAIKLQIRPHFFLNALTTISSLSKQHNDAAVEKYIQTLSENIRYMFKSGLHTVSLQEELSFVESYFEMQELKYPNCVFHFVECNEALYQYQIPQMIIHTIIENEYKYAVSVDSMLTIIIRCSFQNYNGRNCLCIEIEDDGKGYPQNVIDSFENSDNNSHTVTNDGKRVGLLSIKKIMKIMYEDDDLFTISNISPHGCHNKIIIPEKPVNVIQEMYMKVLIVDDDIATVDVIKSNIEWKNLEVEHIVSAYNIKQAKDLLNQNVFDIIISDIEMPQGSGLDLLKWFREQNMQGEFLFLTCHENFNYASDALKLHAFEYLLKPFNVNTMEESIKRIIQNIKEQQQKKTKYISELTKGFYQQLTAGALDSNLSEEVKKRGLDIDTEAEYIAITSNITNTMRDQQKMTHSMFIFMIENLHNENLFEGKSAGNIICSQYNRGFFVESICKRSESGNLTDTVKKLISEIKKTLSVNITVCIGEPCKLSEISNIYNHHIELLKSNVSYTDSFFYEYQIEDNKANTSKVIDIGEFQEYFLEKEKLKIMSSIKNILYKKMEDKTLNEMMLYTLRQELNQCVFKCFATYDIKADGFMTRPEDIDLSVQAIESTSNMIKWVSYLVDCYIETLETNLNRDTDVEKINRFIKEHYSENIGRNEIADFIHLAPEYVSKLYKKKTGITIKDYLNEYRVEQAKLLLQNNALRVSDISDMVGFENFTYFSTIFKKYTQMSPNEYRKSQNLK